jgi:1-phosphofructokinase family hexose kinase
MKALIVNVNLAIDKTVSFPGFKPGRIHRFAGTITQPGGKGVNVARALKELGCRPVVAGFIGGHNGNWIAEHLPRENFPSLLVRHSGGESRICYSVVDSAGVSTDLNEEGPVVPPAAQALLLRRLAKKAGAFQVAAVCGRRSMGLRTGFYTRLTSVLKKAGCFTAFDTTGAPLLEGLRAGADLVKINKSEFEEISGRTFSRPSIRLFFKKYSPLGLKALIVTSGPGVTLAVSQFGLWEARPVPLGRFASPVGAGDSFMAGFLYGFMKGLFFEKNLKLATGCAASDCLTLGAGVISRGQAEAFAAKVRVTEF